MLSVQLARIGAGGRATCKRQASGSIPLTGSQVVDGEILPARPVDGIAGGNGRGVDVLAGTNRDEHRLFLVPTGVADVIDDASLALAAGGLGLNAAGLALYRADVPSAGDALADVMTDWDLFRMPAIRLAEQHHGEVHVYEFAWPSPQLGGRLGAPCAGGPVRVRHPGRRGKRRAVRPVAARRAGGHHAPGVGGLRPLWPARLAAYDLAARGTMTFDVDSTLVHDPPARAARPLGRYPVAALGRSRPRPSQPGRPPPRSSWSAASSDRGRGTQTHLPPVRPGRRLVTMRPFG